MVKGHKMWSRRVLADGKTLALAGTRNYNGAAGGNSLFFSKGMTMRVLVGGIIGAVASAAAWFFLEYATGREMGYLAILVGAITGLCVAAAAGASATESYARGALAVLLTMIAMVGGRAVYAKVMQNVSRVTTLAPAAQTADDVADETVAQAAQGDEAAAEDNVLAQAPPSRTGDGRVRMPKPTVNSYKELEVVWMAVAALVAYLTGKGSGKAAPVVVTEESVPPTGAAGTTA